MINDFLTKFLSKNPIMDDYGLKYNHTFSEEILKIKNRSLKGMDKLKLKKLLEI